MVNGDSRQTTARDISESVDSDKDVVNQSTSQLQTDNAVSDFIPAKRVLKQRRNKGKIEYYVLFADKSRAWATELSPALMQRYRMLQERKREKRRQKRRDRDRTV